MGVEENIKALVSGEKSLDSFSTDEIREMIISKRNIAHADEFKVLAVEGNKIRCQLWNGMIVYYRYENGDFKRL